MKNLRRTIVAVAALMTWFAILAGAQAAEPSFKGKMVRII